ncbi:MAG: hypothetical protein M3R51_00945, partial [Candidatus Eremiobacteraeota bacterium]|nr:hypothetical protein [Candidatus Eremiobacteraeota bacterium]
LGLSSLALRVQLTHSWDAGQSVLLLLAFLICFMDTTLWATLITITPRFVLRPNFQFLVNALHNVCRFLIFWQICMIYVWAVFWKLSGSAWRDGTAMSYVLHIERFQVHAALSNLIAGNGLAAAVLTYGILIFQSAFPICMWIRAMKPIIVLIGIALHVGIGVMLGLVSFSYVMIIADLSLLSDEQFSRFYREAQRASRLATRHFVRLGGKVCGRV